MSVGFIMYEIVDMDSLKYQGINTFFDLVTILIFVGYSLKYQGINTHRKLCLFLYNVGYSLKYQGINTL